MSATEDRVLSGVDVERGLTTQQVADRIRRGAANDLPAHTSRSVGEIVRANVRTRFNAIIGVLFTIILVIGPIQDGLFGFVIIVNTAIGHRAGGEGQTHPRPPRDRRRGEAPSPPER